VAGHRSPVAELEPLLVVVLKESNRARSPMNCDGAINLMNSLLCGSKVEQKAIDWKIENLHAVRSEYEKTGQRPVSASLGK
jgi:hypothetical protein